MQKLGHECILEPLGKIDGVLEQKLKWADVVIFQMVFSDDLVKICKKLGKKVVIEADDLLHTVPKTHYNYDELRGWGGIKWILMMRRLLKMADGFICTVPELKQVYGKWCKNTLVFPNYLDLEHWYKEYKRNMGEQIRVLWAGSTSHRGDLFAFRPVIKTILEKYGNKIKFIYVGVGGVRSNDLYAQFIHGDDVFEGLPTNRESLIAYPSNIWPYKLAAIEADIAIAPLEKNYFNKFKSTCKYLEYSINKIPAVYEKWFYKRAVKDGENGLLAEGQEEWIRKISLLIDNELTRKTMGEIAFSDVMDHHRVDNYLENWHSFIKNIVGGENK
jgi:glycosyltransferase involved in cell wall biosynthesis